MSEICAWELRATLLGNQPDWKPTHETTYQHTRRRCDGRRRVRRARASFEIDHSESSASRVAISRTAGPDGAQKTSGATSTNTPLERREGRAAADTTARGRTPYGPLHPLRGATPVMGRCTRYGARHPLRGTTPDQKRCTAYGSGAHPITRTNAESARRSPTRTRPQELAQFNEVLRRWECDTHKAPGARAPGAPAQQQLSQRSTSRRRGRR